MTVLEQKDAAVGMDDLLLYEHKGIQTSDEFNLSDRKIVMKAASPLCPDQMENFRSEKCKLVSCATQTEERADNFLQSDCQLQTIVHNTNRRLSEIALHNQSSEEKSLWKRSCETVNEILDDCIELKENVRLDKPDWKAEVRKQQNLQDFMFSNNNFSAQDNIDTEGTSEENNFTPQLTEQRQNANEINFEIIRIEHNYSLKDKRNDQTQASALQNEYIAEDSRHIKNSYGEHQINTSGVKAPKSNEMEVKSQPSNVEHIVKESRNPYSEHSIEAPGVIAEKNNQIVNSEPTNADHTVKESINNKISCSSEDLESTSRVNSEDNEQMQPSSVELKVKEFKHNKNACSEHQIDFSEASAEKNNQMEVESRPYSIEHPVKETRNDNPCFSQDLESTSRVNSEDNEQMQPSSVELKVKESKHNKNACSEHQIDFSEATAEKNNQMEVESRPYNIEHTVKEIMNDNPCFSEDWKNASENNNQLQSESQHFKVQNVQISEQCRANRNSDFDKKQMNTSRNNSGSYGTSDERISSVFRENHLGNENSSINLNHPELTFFLTQNNVPFHERLVHIGTRSFDLALQSCGRDNENSRVKSENSNQFQLESHPSRVVNEQIAKEYSYSNTSNFDVKQLSTSRKNSVSVGTSDEKAYSVSRENHLENENSFINLNTHGPPYNLNQNNTPFREQLMHAGRLYLEMALAICGRNGENLYRGQKEKPHFTCKDKRKRGIIDTDDSSDELRYVRKKRFGRKYVHSRKKCVLESSDSETGSEISSRHHAITRRRIISHKRYLLEKLRKKFIKQKKLKKQKKFTSSYKKCKILRISDSEETDNLSSDSEKMVNRKSPQKNEECWNKPPLSNQSNDKSYMKDRNEGVEGSGSNTNEIGQSGGCKERKKITLGNCTVQNNPTKRNLSSQQSCLELFGSDNNFSSDEEQSSKRRKKHKNNSKEGKFESLNEIKYHDELRNVLYSRQRLNKNSPSGSSVGTAKLSRLQKYRRDLIRAKLPCKIVEGHTKKLQNGKRKKQTRVAKKISDVEQDIKDMNELKLCAKNKEKIITDDKQMLVSDTSERIPKNVERIQINIDEKSPTSDISELITGSMKRNQIAIDRNMSFSGTGKRTALPNKENAKITENKNASENPERSQIAADAKTLVSNESEIVTENIRIIHTDKKRWMSDTSERVSGNAGIQNATIEKTNIVDVCEIQENTAGVHTNSGKTIPANATGGEIVTDGKRAISDIGKKTVENTTGNQIDSDDKRAISEVGKKMPENATGNQMDTDGKRAISDVGKTTPENTTRNLIDTDDERGIWKLGKLLPEITTGNLIDTGDKRVILEVGKAASENTTGNWIDSDDKRYVSEVGNKAPEYTIGYQIDAGDKTAISDIGKKASENTTGNQIITNKKSTKQMQIATNEKTPVSDEAKKDTKDIRENQTLTGDNKEMKCAERKITPGKMISDVNAGMQSPKIIKLLIINDKQKLFSAASKMIPKNTQKNQIATNEKIPNSDPNMMLLGNVMNTRSLPKILSRHEPGSFAGIRTYGPSVKYKTKIQSDKSNSDATFEKNSQIGVFSPSNGSTQHFSSPSCKGIIQDNCNDKGKIVDFKMDMKSKTVSQNPQESRSTSSFSQQVTHGKNLIKKSKEVTSQIPYIQSLPVKENVKSYGSDHSVVKLLSNIPCKSMEHKNENFSKPVVSMQESVNDRTFVEINNKPENTPGNVGFSTISPEFSNYQNTSIKLADPAMNKESEAIPATYSSLPNYLDSPVKQFQFATFPANYSVSYYLNSTSHSSLTDKRFPTVPAKCSESSSPVKQTSPSTSSSLPEKGYAGVPVTCSEAQNCSYSSVKQVDPRMTKIHATLPNVRSTLPNYLYSPVKKYVQGTESGSVEVCPLPYDQKSSVEKSNEEEANVYPEVPSMYHELTQFTESPVKQLDENITIKQKDQNIPVKHSDKNVTSAINAYSSVSKFASHPVSLSKESRMKQIPMEVNSTSGSRAAKELLSHQSSSEQSCVPSLMSSEVNKTRMSENNNDKQYVQRTVNGSVEVCQLPYYQKSAVKQSSEKREKVYPNVANMYHEFPQHPESSVERSDEYIESALNAYSSVFKLASHPVSPIKESTMKPVSMEGSLATASGTVRDLLSCHPIARQRSVPLTVAVKKDTYKSVNNDVPTLEEDAKVYVRVTRNSAHLASVKNNKTAARKSEAGLNIQNVLCSYDKGYKSQAKKSNGKRSKYIFSFTFFPPKSGNVVEKQFYRHVSGIECRLALV